MELIQENIDKVFIGLTVATVVVGTTFLILVARIRIAHKEYITVKARTAELSNSLQAATVALNSYILNLLKKQQELQYKTCNCKEEPTNKTEIQGPQQ